MEGTTIRNLNHMNPIVPVSAWRITHKLMGFYMEGLILGVSTIYMLFCFSGWMCLLPSVLYVYTFLMYVITPEWKCMSKFSRNVLHSGVCVFRHWMSPFIAKLALFLGFLTNTRSHSSPDGHGGPDAPGTHAWWT